MSIFNIGVVLSQTVSALISIHTNIAGFNYRSVYYLLHYQFIIGVTGNREILIKRGF